MAWRRIYMAGTLRDFIHIPKLMKWSTITQYIRSQAANLRIGQG